MPSVAVMFDLVIGGAAFAFGIVCLQMWRARRGHTWFGWMALMSVSQVVLALGQLLRNACPDAVMGDLAARLNGASATLAGLSWLCLVLAFCDRRRSRWDWPLLIAGVLLIPLQLAIPGGLSFTQITHIGLIQAGWWGPITIVEGPVSPFALCIHLIYLAMAVRIAVVTWTSRRRLDRISLTLMLVSVAAVLVPIVHGYGLKAGWWHGVPLAEYALATVFLLLGSETYRRESIRDREERDRQQRLEAILGHGQGFAGLIGTDGRLILANQTSLSAVGVDAGTVTGQPFPATPWWRDNPQAQERLRTAITTAASGTPDRFITTHRLPDGRIIDIDFCLTPYRDSAGTITYLIAEGRDITELRRYESGLREASRMQAIGQLAGGIAHDFNNLLSGIMGSAELVLLQSRDAQIRTRLELILSTASRAGDLTKRLLVYAQKYRSTAVEVGINRMVAETIELFGRGAGPSIRLERSLTAIPDTIIGDPAELQSALLNLCVNARDAMPTGGILQVTTLRQDLRSGSSDCLGLPIASGTYLRIDVSDHGTGMSEEVRSRIFEPYFTTKSAGQGTGLGLPAVLGTIRAHRGALLLRTSPGRGTIISMLLPAVAPGTGSASMAPLTPTHGGSLLVLVDDDALVREHAAELLSTLGLAIEAHADPIQAQERLRTVTGIDCLMLDLDMPGLNGRALYQQVRTLSAALPIIICSGFAGGGDVVGADQDTKLAFLPKPWRLAQMRQTLHDLGVLRPS